MNSLFSLIFIMTISLLSIHISISLSTSEPTSSSLASEYSMSVWLPSLYNGAHIELVSMLLNQSRFMNVYVEGSQVMHSPFRNYYQNNPGIHLTTINYQTHTTISFDATGSQQDKASASGKELEEIESQKIYSLQQSNPTFQNVDAVVCTSPVSQCISYIALNKSIVWLAGSQRYNAGRQCDTEAWDRLNKYIDFTLHRSASSAPSFIVASNLFDQAFINYYTGLQALLMEPVGMLYGELHLANSEYDNQQRHEILLGPSQGVFLSSNHQSELAKLARYHGVSLVHPTRLYGRYQLRQLARHRAVVMFPISIQSHYFIELYAMGIPILMPTVSFLAKLGTMADWRTTKALCEPNVQDSGLHHSYNHGNHHAAEFDINAQLSTRLRRHPKSIESRDPESNNLDEWVYWMNKTAYYSWPHVIQFQSFEELFLLLNTTNWDAVHRGMMQQNEIRFESSRFCQERMLYPSKM